MTKKTKALLVGINDYAPAGSGGSDLNGCINDVRDMANTLVICGYAPQNIRIITNSRATAAAIHEGLDWLLRGAQAGDALVFYYSGHGSYVVDTSGDELDGRDEVICPHDWPNMITDDQLADHMKRLPAGVNLEVFMDCCHAGTNTRTMLTPTLTPRFIQPPLDYSFYTEFKALPVKSSKRVVVPVLGLNHCLWAACADDQLSNETTIEGMVRGIFTYHICSILRATSGIITREKLDVLLSASVARHGYAQKPQLELVPSLKSKPIFKL